jgi:hypothetical protein
MEVFFSVKSDATSSIARVCSASTHWRKYVLAEVVSCGVDARVVGQLLGKKREIRKQQQQK